MGGYGGLEGQHSSYKRWDPSFEKDSDFRDNESAVEKRRKLKFKSDDVNIFMRHQDIRSSRPVEAVISYCKGATIDNVKSGNGRAGTRRAAWVDDRSINRNTPARSYENPLTATGVYNALHEKRYDHDSLDTVNRRLVFVRNPDPDYYLALGHTATEYQLAALTDSFCRQQTSKPFITIKFPPLGIRRFVMNLDVPFFELRNRRPSSQDASYPGLHTRERQPRFTDLSILFADSPGFQNQQKPYLHSAHFSFRIIGMDHRNWTAYAFVRGETDDLVPDPEEPDEDGELEGEEDDDEDDDTVALPIEDLIASATELDMPAVRADEPIFNPRVYFLVIFEHSAVRIVKEWTDVVDVLQHHVENHEHQNSTSQAPEGNGGVRDTGQAFKLTQNSLRLLRPLHDVLSKTITAWEVFVNRDIALFSDLVSLERDDDLAQRARNSLDAIRQSSDELKRLCEDLNALMESCQASAAELKLQLILESSKAAHHNSVIADFANVIMNPATLVATCFSMPQGTLPFKADFKTFVVATIIAMISFRVLFVGLGWVLRPGRPKDDLLARLTHFNTDVTILRPTRDCLRSLGRRQSSPSREIDDIGLDGLDAV